jgi:hypothetical protein
MKPLNERQIAVLRIVKSYHFKKYYFKMPMNVVESYDHRTLSSLIHRGLIEYKGGFECDSKGMRATSSPLGLAMTEKGLTVLENLSKKQKKEPEQNIDSDSFSPSF